MTTGSPIAKSHRMARETDYSPQALIQRLETLMKKNNLSYRETALNAGLDHQAMRRILSGQRPNMVACILLADFFEINPNEFLELANWPTLKTFSIRTDSAENLPVEAVEVARALAKINNPGMRKEVAGAILTLIGKYFD